MGDNTAFDRAVQDLLDFDDWSSNSIEKRQNMYASIAHKVWDMPVSGEAVG